MPRRSWFILVMGIILLAACTPEVFMVEVTRLVESEPAPTVISGIAEAAAAPTVEVTRIVMTEVTRVVSETVVVEATRVPLGSGERPLQLLFAPQIPTSLLQERAEPLTAALREATGLEVVVGIVDDEEAVQTLLCAAPQDTIALLSPLAAGQVSLDCNSQVLAVGVGNNGLAWDAGMIVVGRGSGLAELADLEGKIWAVGDQTSLPNYFYVQALLADLGITLAETRFFPGDNTALLAVFNGEADFATASYLPPVLPFSEREWVYGQDEPELWRRLGIPPTRSGQGFVIVNGAPEFGGYRVRDARAGIFDTTPEIFAATEIMTLTAPMPLDTFVVGAQFPLGLARQVEAALIAFGGSGACADSLCAADFLNWAGIIPAVDENYDPLRLIVRYNGPQTDQE